VQSAKQALALNHLPANQQAAVKREENAGAGGAEATGQAAEVGTVEEATAPDPVTPAEEKMLWQMYGQAKLSVETRKLVEGDWQSKTHDQRQADYDAFMRELEAARREVQGHPGGRTSFRNLSITRIGA